MIRRLTDPRECFGAPIGGHGFSVPALEPLVGHRISDLLPPKNLVVRHHGAADCWIYLPPGWEPARPFHVELGPRAVGCTLLVGADSKIGGRVEFGAEGETVLIGGRNPWYTPISVFMNGRNSTLLWGRGATANGVRLFVDGEGRRILVGDDCMFSGEIDIRTSDRHVMFSMEDETVLNAPEDVVIEPHVWLGFRTIVLKGTRVGFGSVIGTSAVVTQDIPRFSLAVGQPARVIRQGVSWSRNLMRPEPGGRDRLRAEEARLDSWPVSSSTRD